MTNIHVLAFDIGGTNIRAVVVDRGGNVVFQIVVPAEQFRQSDPIEFMAEIAERQGRDIPGGIDGIVVGVPGIMDRTRRSVIVTPLVPNLQIEKFADLLQERCGVPVILDHDATLQTRGEALKGAAAGHDLVLGVYFGTGVGGAFLDSGNLMGGPYRMQLGHVPLRGDGRVGTGGATDCVEAYASGLVLQSIASKHGRPIAELFVEAHTELDGELKTFLSDQALTIATAITLTDPEVVVVGGGVVEMTGYPFDELVRLVNEKLSPVIGREKRPIRKAELGMSGATWGAIGLFRNAE